MFAPLAHLVYRRPWAVLFAALAFFAGALVLLARGGELGASRIAGLEADEAQVELDAIVGRPDDTTVVVVFRSADLKPTDPSFQQAMSDALAPLRNDPDVAAIVTPEDAPTMLIERMRNAQARSAVAFVTLAGDLRHALAVYPHVRDKLVSNTLSVTCTGQVPYQSDLATVLEHDLVRAELLSLPVALLILALVFRTAVASMLPVGVGGMAVLGGIAIVTALSRSTEMPQYTINVCSLIGFGVAIDYSLFIVSRYREELATGRDFRDALVRAVDTAGRAVTFSGIAVATGLAGLFFFRGSYLAFMGLGGSIVVFLAVVFALALLPALLVILGPRIHFGRLPGVQATRTPGRHWKVLAERVMRAPFTVLLPTVAFLLVLAAPAARLRIAASDVRILPHDVEARRGFEQLREAFPDMVATRIAVVVRFPNGTVFERPRLEAVSDLSRRVAAIPGVERVESIVDRPRAPTDEEEEPPSRDEIIETLLHPPEMLASTIEAAKSITTRGPKTVLFAITSAPPESARAEAIVRAIRTERNVLDGQLLVGGQAARNVDSTEFILSRAPYAVLFVMGVTFVVVLVMLRSLLLPLKAIVMNALSIGASFGVLVWIFQDGHLFVTEGRPLEPALPVLLFCVAFGLSMDYEVLMLARMKEAYARTGDNVTAVGEGLENSAGLVTSAAAIMVSVFIAFALARVVVLQETGVGLALAVALDATLVRALLVPSTMRLLGHLNWWAPRWLGGSRNEPPKEQPADD
jgi:putative drug exporter of the RND superfamily